MLHRIDTIRVGGTLAAVDETAPGWHVSQETTETGYAERGRYRQLSPGVNLLLSPGAQRSAWVEGSPAKFLTGHNYPALDDEAAFEVGRLWLSMAADFVTLGETARLGRVDVVRDFPTAHTEQAEQVLRALGSSPVSGSKVKAFYRDPSEHHAATVHVRTRRAGMGRLYDKGRESGLESASGVLRFEGQERRRGTLGLRTLDSLVTEPEFYEAIGRERFSWCGFDTPMVAWPQLVERIITKKGSHIRTRLDLIGYAALIREGGAPRLGYKEAEYRMRKRLREVGIPCEVSCRLDWDGGLLLAA